MLPSGFQADRAQGGAVPAVNAAAVKHGHFAALLVRLADHFPVLDLIVDQVIAQGEFIRHVAGHHAQVLPADIMFPELGVQPRCRLAGPGKHHQPADGAVQPVHQAQVDVAGLVILLFNIVLQYAQDIRIPGPVRLGQHVRRFDRHQHLVILVQDIPDQVNHAATSRWRRRAARRPRSRAGTALRCPPSRRSGSPRTSPACCSARLPGSRWYSC